MNISYNNIYRKDLGWLHFDDTPGIPSVAKNISKHQLISNHHETNQKQYVEMQNYYISYPLIILISSVQSIYIIMVNLSLILFRVVLMIHLSTLNKCLTTASMNFSRHSEAPLGIFICISIIYISYFMFLKFQTNSQYRIQTFFEHTIFLKSVIEWFTNTRNPSMMGAGGPDIFDVRCSEGSISVSLENISIPKYS